METESKSVGTVRGTQSFVHVLSWCWKRPRLTALEVAWRWAFGVPAAALVWYEATHVLSATRWDVGSLRQMTFLDPAGAAETLSQTAAVLGPAVLHVLVWLAPLLFAAWVIVSAAGRAMVLRRVDPRLQGRLGTLVALQAMRTIALAAVFVVWLECVRAAGRFAVNGPMATGDEPSLVLYCALVIVATSVTFALWAAVSWVLAMAPLISMVRGLGVRESLAATLRLGAVRGKLVEINLVMGIVRIALVVLAMVASACPLPFESVATPGFMTDWYCVVAVLYLLGSDFFHVVRAVYSLEMWKAFAGGETLAVAAQQPEMKVASPR